MSCRAPGKTQRASHQACDKAGGPALASATWGSCSRSLPGMSFGQTCLRQVEGQMTPSSPPQENAWPIQAFFWLEWVGCDPDPPLVSLGEPVTFSIFRVFCMPNGMFFDPKQIRHPERSAAQIYRITEGLCAKSKDPGDICWQMLFQAFRPRTTSQIKKVTKL
jgi:hypothetical protein